MKRIYSLFLMVFITGVMYAQSVSTYTFYEVAASYTALTGGTASSASGDDGTQNGISIGFNFKFGSTAYTHFCISTNGLVKLGSSTTTITGSYGAYQNALSNTATDRPLLGVLWDDNHRSNGTISYLTSGTAGSRVLTIDWNNVSIAGGTASATNLASYQVRLYEASNKIEFIYGTLNPAGTLSASIGLNDASSFLSVTPGAPATVSSAVANNAISSTTDFAAKKYTFLPPTGCAATTVIPPAGPFPYITDAVDNSNAALTGDPVPACVNSAKRAVWWSFTPQTSGSYKLSSCQSDAPLSAISDNAIAVFTAAGGCGGTFTQVAGGCDDDACTTLDYQGVINTLSLTAGTTYYILIYGYDSNVTGNAQLYVNLLLNCPVPTGVTAGNITSAGATISWTGSGASYILEYGASGFTPGTGATAGTGGTVINPAATPQAITGLAPTTTYQVYVRQNCTATGNGYSQNTAPVSFSTMPNDLCSNALVIPPAGPFPYTTVAVDNSAATGTGDPVPTCQTNSNRGLWWSFTPSASTYYKISSCQSDAAGSAIADNVVAVFTSTAGCSGPFTQVAGGCDDDGCTTLNLQGVINSLLLNSGTTYYILVYGFNASTGPAQLNISIAPTANDKCIGALVIPAAGPFPYTTQAVNNSTATETGDPAATCGSNNATGNKGVWWTFTPSATGTYKISSCQSDAPLSTINDNVLSIFTSAAACAGPFTSIACDDDGCTTLNFQGVINSVSLTAGTTYYILVYGYNTMQVGNAQLYVDAIGVCLAPTGVTASSITSNSASVSWTGTGTFVLEYGPTGFTPGTGATAGAGGTVINPATSPQAISGLTQSTTYQVYVRKNCTATGAGYSSNSAVSFTTPAALPPNDDAINAIALTVNAGCTGAPYTNAAATAGASEPYPSCSGTKVAPVWFKFVAPASGAVRVSTDVSGGTFTDSKIGLFSATNPADYTSFNIISCDEDGGSAVGSGFLSVLYATGLTAGSTYYVAVDKYLASTASGTFCITVESLSTAMLSATNTCTSGYQSIYSNGATNYTGWLPLLDSSSNLVALVRNPAGMTPTDFRTFQQNINTGAVRQTGGVYYLNRNFRIASTETNVDVQFFFLQTELAALAAQDAGATLASLGGAKQVDANGCQNNFAAANGAFVPFTQSGNGTSGGVNWITATVPSFSNFYLYKSMAIVPVAIEYFRGSKQGADNFISWKVNCAGSTSLRLILERSADGSTFLPIEDQSAANVRCQQGFSYLDQSVMKGANYYRLRTINPDGEVRVSQIILLMNDSQDASILSIAPNPVIGHTTVTLVSVNAGRAEVSVSDLAGRVVAKKYVSVVPGRNSFDMNFSKLVAGTYNITVLGADGEKQTVKFVRL